MKHLALPLLISLLLHVSTFGQNSYGFKYQAVARDVTGYPITNQDISLKIKLFTLNGNNSDDYIEYHYITSNNFGLINIDVGHGEVEEGDFQNIDWSIGEHFIELSIDPSGGNDFIFLGSSEILSVPMANYATVAGNVVDTSLTNELQKLTLSHTNILELSPEGNSVYLGIYDDTDAIDSLGQKISSDSLYFEIEISELASAIEEEIIRATNAEINLAQQIAENSLHIFNDSLYFQYLIDNISNSGDSLYLKTLIDNNTLRIINDSVFLKSLIDANYVAIQQEITRAILSEAINAGNINSNTISINQLQIDLESDSIFLKNLIDQNSYNITAEITRAIGAELQNTNNISQNSQTILANQINIFSDSIHFQSIMDQIDFDLQEEITRAIYRDEMNSDSIEMLYFKVYTDSISFQNQINNLSGGGLDPTLENGKIFIGDASNTAVGVNLSGDAQITNTGVLILNPSSITTPKIANSQVTNDKLANPSFTIKDENGNSGELNLGNQLQFNGNGATQINYNPVSQQIDINSTDNQILQVSGNNLIISSGNAVDLSAIVGQTGPIGPIGPTGPAGNDGNGIQATVNNGNGTFTIFYTNGSSFTTANFTGPQGPQGPVGPQGAIGPQGNNGVGILSTTNNGDGTFTINYTDGSSFTSSDLTGPQGPTGLMGPQGISGPTGSDGVGISSSINNGDGTFTIYYTDGSSFTTANLTGPQGPQGPIGPQGAIGPQGPVGPQGNQGIGIQSTVDNGDGTFTLHYTDGSSFTTADFTGPQGIQGFQGAQGIQGIQGIGVLSTVDNGNGTFTINYTDGSSFTTADFSGPQGIQGPQGDQGSQGIQGTQGVQGVAGENGASINWLGTIYPAPSSPSLNDGFHDPVQRKSFIWNGTVWLTISEDGAIGPQGPSGPVGPAGTSLRDCPAGDWSAINEQFCIEVNERSASTWWNASKFCGDQDSHLCSWDEWYYTCQKTGSGTINMTNDWEWTDEGQGGAIPSANVVGNGGCISSSTDDMNNTNTYRCCFTR